MRLPDDIHRWLDVSLELDGSLRDIYGHGLSWKPFLAALAASAYPHRFTCDGELVPPVTEWPGDEHRSCHSLRIDITPGVVVIGHFFDDTIELDVDPRDLRTRDSREALAGFLSVMAAACHSELLLTMENIDDWVLLSAGPTGQVSVPVDVAHALADPSPRSAKRLTWLGRFGDPE